MTALTDVHLSVCTISTSSLRYTKHSGLPADIKQPNNSLSVIVYHRKKHRKNENQANFRLIA